MDMPPQPSAVYVVAPVKEKASSGIHAQVARFLGAERIRAEQKAGITIGSFDAARRLPPMDLSSPRLTQAERQGMAMVVEASRGGRLGATGVTMTDGYVARRMGAAVLAARIAERSQAGHEVSARQIDAVRCRLVAVVMDPRAGGYVKGGERAAAVSRASLSKGDVELCRPAIEAQARRISAERKSVTPGASSTAPVRASTAPVRASVAPVAQRSAAVGISPNGTVRQRIDPVGSVRRRIDPIGPSEMSMVSKGPKVPGTDVQVAMMTRATNGRAGR